MPWAGVVVSLAGALVIAVTTVAVDRFAPSSHDTGETVLGLVTAGVVLAATLLLVTALVCLLPLLLRRFPQLRSPLTYGTAVQLRRFLDWFLVGATIFALVAYLGATGLTAAWGVSFAGATFVGLGALLISIGIGYPRGGPQYDGTVPFVAAATEEFARFAPLQKYGTSILGAALIVAGAWLPASSLVTATAAGAAVLWLLPWIVALARAAHIEQESRK